MQIHPGFDEWRKNWKPTKEEREMMDDFLRELVNEYPNVKVIDEYGNELEEFKPKKKGGRR